MFVCHKNLRRCILPERDQDDAVNPSEDFKRMRTGLKSTYRSRSGPRRAPLPPCTMNVSPRFFESPGANPGLELKAKSDFANRALKFRFIYSFLGLIFGLTFALGGIVLCLNGVVGSTSWTAKILGAKSEVSDATPGVILFIVGLFVVFITRFKVKLK